MARRSGGTAFVDGAEGVIEKVPVGESLTLWLPIVVVPKKSSAEPRITVDLTGLNKSVQRPVPCPYI